LFWLHLWRRILRELFLKILKR
jgi:hypothetical protein